MSATVQPSHQATEATSTVSVRQIASNDTARWEEFLAKSAGANLYHTPAWRDVVAECFRHTPVYLLSERANQVTGVLPLFLIRNPFLGCKLISMPYDIGSGGAIAADHESERALVAQAVVIARDYGAKFIELRPSRPQPVLAELGFRHSEPVIISDMELGAGETAVWERVSKDHMKAIRKAKTRGVEVRVANTRRDFHDFYAVYLEVFRAFGTPPYGSRYFELLHDKLHPSAAVKLFTAHVDGRCVGGLQLFCWGKNLVSKFAACLPEAVPLRAYPALYAAAIEFGVTAKYETLSWGTSSRAQKGLIEFKEGWGATSRAAQIYSMPIRGAAPDLEKYYDGDALPQRVWRKLPLSWTRVMGQPLNRWFC